MVQLGIQINANLITGKTTAYSKNEGVWVRKIIDDRDVISNFIGLNNHDTLMCIRYIDEGILLMLIVPKFGRGKNANVTANLFIPSDAVVPGSDLVKTIRLVSEQMHNEQLNSQLLDELFSQQYEERLAIHKVTPCNNGKIAVRKYGVETVLKYSLTDLLDEKYIYQPQYMSYQYIYFVDSSLKLQCQGMSEIKDSILLDSVTFSPIKSTDGFVPYISGIKFQNPILVYKGEKITVVWKKPQYSDVTKQYTIPGNSQLPALTEADYNRIISYDYIDVRDQHTRKQVQNYELLINGQRLISGGSMPVSEAKLKETEIQIVADGYDGHMACYNINERVTIFLKPKTYRYVFELELINGDIQQLEVKSHCKFTRTPFKGYHNPYRKSPSEHERNWIEYKPFDKSYKRKLLITLATTFLVGFISALCLVFFLQKRQGDDSKKGGYEYTPNQVTTSQPVKESAPKTKDIYDKVIEYMDANDKWEKSTLDDFNVVPGLWDALNVYDFVTIKKFAEPLKDSKKFSELMDAINVNSQKKYPSKPWDNEGNEKITISKYIKFLNGKQEDTSDKKAQSSKQANKKSTSSDFD